MRNIDAFWYDPETLREMRALKKTVKNIGNLPQKCVTPAARKGARIWLKAVKASAPVGDTGNLRKGIILKGEKSPKKGKKVYDVMFDPAMNDVFVKSHTAGENAYSVRNKTGKAGQTVRAYYPASMEFGYFARNGRYIPGYHFMRDSATETAPEVQQTVIKELTKNVDKEWLKKNG